MAEALSLYPLSTLAGEPIPYEVIRVLGVAHMAFTDTVSAAISIPASAGLLSVFTTSHCLLGIGVTASAPSSGVFAANHVFVPGNSTMNIDHNGAATLTVIGLQSPGGDLFINFVDKWKDIRKSVQYARG